MKETKGAYRVGLSFNPSGDDTVTRIKAMAAGLIDLIEDEVPMQAASSATDSRREAEVHRLKALAQTAIEEGAMWAVKAATKR